MNAKYSFSRYVIATLAAAAVLVLPTACKDDLGYQGIEGQQIAFKLTAPDAWHDGMPINENAPTTHCTSVRALSGGDTKLYLHTVVADNPAEDKVVESRGTLVTGKDADEAAAAFKKTYFRFSLSGVYSDGSSLYDLHYESATGTPMNIGKQLLWPSAKNSVKVYAFAPTIEDFNNSLKSNADDSSTDDDVSLVLNEADSPTLTYTVPKDVTKQVDLMTAKTSIPSLDPQPELQFGHALTAVQIKCGKDMLAGTITEVTIEGIKGTGTWEFESNNWIETSGTATYTISKKITLSPSTDESVADKIHVPENTPIVGTDTDNLTFMLLPQTLPDGATMTIKFTDDATQTERTLSGSLAEQTWEAGKIVTYSVSQSSININAKIEFDSNTIPYSGVWYEYAYKAKAEVTQVGAETKAINIPANKVQFQYKMKDSDPSWTNCKEKGVVAIEPQPAYETMNRGFDKTSENGSEEIPYSLPSEYDNETANCYLVDKAGYYSLPLVYGNGYLTLPTDNPDGFIYFPKHDDDPIPKDGKIDGVEDAVLCWQDAPNLIDTVWVDGDNLVFRIRKQTLAQGNALLAVRGTDLATNKKIILWSWHIWVTPYKSQFYSEFYNSVTDAKPTGYDMAKYNLGWCDPHPTTDEERTFSLQAVIDMSAYGGTTETVNLGTFTQMEFKGSNAGDNTYYQWGRKDPMLGGIYNNKTPKYQYQKKHGIASKETTDKDEFTMENKQVFNQYNKDGYNYSFCKNPGDKIDLLLSDPASNGVTIGYSIQHPYMFVTNSRCNDDSGESSPFNYRNHWHVPYMNSPVDYLNEGTHIMFNAWDAGATAAPENMNHNLTARNIVKSVYDPCPPRFKVPPLDAFRGIVTYKSYGSGNDIAWKLEHGGAIEFPMTGVRNYALRNNEWKTVVPLGSSSDADEEFCKAFYKTSMPAFRMLTFVSTATIIPKKATVGEGYDSYDAYQVAIFRIDHNNRFSMDYNKIEFIQSSNSYGLTVRPIKDNNSSE